MKKIFRTALAATVGLTLAACGGSDKKDPEVVVVPPPTPTTLDITGQAVKGTFAGALVEVFNANDLTIAIGSAAQTDATGNYTVTITDEEGNPIVGAYVVKVSADDDSTMVCDALTCGDLAQGDLIPAVDLTGLTLSSFTYSDGTGNIEANVNAITTMTTDAILSAAVANENLDLSDVTQETVTSLQSGASQVVGSLLNIDLSQANIYNVNIVDASVAANVATDDAIAATLTLINASFSGLDTNAVAGRTNPSYSNRTADQGLGFFIAQYLTTIKEVIQVLIVPGATIDSVSTDKLAIINNTQSQFSTLVADLANDIAMTTGNSLEVTQLLTSVDLQQVIDNAGAINGTGGTGGTNP